MPPKSIFRQPGARHFQLVHRSQRDPLIHDPDASKHVLKPIERENAKKGKTRADLESILPSSEIINDKLASVGEAAIYGVYYDDTEYNYMQHLRAVGVQEDGIESVLIEAPSTSKSSKSQAKNTKGIEMRDLPQEVLASKSELPRTYESQQAVPEEIAGFQPDMDPHLRQVLEALDDDAFVNDDLDDDFFGELVADGERASDEEVAFEFEEDSYKGSQAPEGDVTGGEGGWEQRFAQFKQAQKNKQAQSDDGYNGSEGGDTVGTLPAMSVIGGKKRRKGTSDASGYSMSSSSMYRNEALQTLDERFDQMIIKQYNEEEDTPEEDGNDSDEAPELITSREDFESMMDEFLNDYEILGRKMKLKLAGETGAEKLDTIRRAMGQDERVRIGNLEDSEDDDDIIMPLDVDDKKDRWDCETILTTYSNLENHPRLLRARDPKPIAKIHLDPKTGFPTMVNPVERTQLKSKSARGHGSFHESDDDSDYDTDTPARQTIARPRDESKEDKKARKAAVKAERQTRRADKKAVKEQFGAELKSQKRTIGNKEKRLKKL